MHEQIYSSSFSSLVVKQLLEKHSRGWHILQEMFPKINQTRISYLFMYNQQRWNHFKKTLKLADRLANSPWYSDNHPLIFRNIREQVPYFKETTARKVDSKYHPAG